MKTALIIMGTFNLLLVPVGVVGDFSLSQITLNAIAGALCLFVASLKS